MTTRRRFERRGIERRIQKRQEERLSENLTKARDALDVLIDDLDVSDAGDVVDALQGVDAVLGRAYRQAESMAEGDNR